MLRWSWRLALVPPRPSVLPPGAGNEPKKPIKAQERAKKREDRYVAEARAIDRQMHATTVRRDDDGDLSAVLLIETAQSGLPYASPARRPRVVRAV